MRNNKNNLTWKLTTFYIFIVSISLTGAIDEKVSSPLPTSATSAKQSTSSLAPSSSSTISTNDEIYIDDEGVGSGHGGIHDDLEKNSDYSGSGFGPDDEDSIGNNNSRNNNNKYHKPSETGGTYSSNKYNNIGVGGNNNNNNGNEHSSISSTTSSTSTTRHKPILSNSDLSFVDSEDGKNDDENEYGSSGDDIDDDDDDTTDTDHEVHSDPDDHLGFKKQSTNSQDNGNTEQDTKKDDKNINVNINNNDNLDQDEIEDYEDEIENENEDFNKKSAIDDGDNHDVKNNTTDIQPNLTESSNKDIIINNNNEVVPGEEIGRTNLNPPGGINPGPNEVLIMNEERTTSFFAQPGILAAVIGGAVVGLLCAILVVMFIVYRMRKKDEGSYALDEPKRSPAVNSYAKNGNNREFYA